MLTGRKAVITGGSRGIGRAIALALAAQGADIAILYAGNSQAAAEVCAQAQKLGVQAQSHCCDVSNAAQVEAACTAILQAWGGVDILVNNAGITKDNLLLRMSEADFDAVVDVNLKGAFLTIKQLCRPLMKSPHGRIINLASVSGLMGNPGQANYAAAKAGMIGLTKTMAKELASRQVTCNAIAPGFIDTDMTAHLPQSVKDFVQTGVPLKRMGTPQEVAALAVFLASDAAAYITGTVIAIDGGMTM